MLSLHVSTEGIVPVTVAAMPSAERTALPVGSPQGKLVFVIHGKVFDVAVDIRYGSPTFGRYRGIVLSSEKYRQIYIPAGFAHGFCVLGKSAVVLYKCTDYYSPKEERGIRWDDPSLNIAWPVLNPLLSKKDQAYPFLGNIPLEELPPYSATR